MQEQLNSTFDASKYYIRRSLIRLSTVCKVSRKRFDVMKLATYESKSMLDRVGSSRVSSVIKVFRFADLSVEAAASERSIEAVRVQEVPLFLEITFQEGGSDEAKVRFEI